MNPPVNALDFSKFAEMYERWLVKPLFRPWADDIFESTRLTPGERLLDVACGTGAIARAAKERLGRGADVVGIDVNPAMLGVARSVEPSIDWREGDAAALPLGDDEEFDVVVCHHGIQFMPDRAAAAREMRRALAPGGRIALASWCSDEEIPFFRALRRVAERHVGRIDDRRHSFGDPAAIERLLSDAGFEDAEAGTVSRTIRVREFEAFVHLNTMALIGMSGPGKEMDHAARTRIAAVIAEDNAEALRPYVAPDGLSFDMSTVLATATKAR